MIVRAAILLVAIVCLAPSPQADAAPITLAAYRDALVSARSQVDAARQASGDQRRRSLDGAIATLRDVTAVQTNDATFTALPHEPILTLLASGDDQSLERASGILGETVAALTGGAGTVIDPARARAVLDATLGSSDFRRQPSWTDALAELIRDGLAALFPNLRAPTINTFQIAAVLSGVIALLFAIVITNATRGLRAKITREAVLAAALASERPGAADHLRAADDAIRHSRLRDALRELFLAALAGLEERGGLRLDPALTDREILARAAGSPRADDLTALVALYEPAWYGVREPSSAEIARASELARRIGT